MNDYSYLLSRQEHCFNEDGIDEALRGKRVLVTGAGGTIGSAIVRRVLKAPVEFVGAIGHSEAPIFNLMQSLSPEDRSITSKAIASVADETAMGYLFAKWQPDYVFHAAAHKHVGLMESQPAEAFRNNTLATLNLATLALQSRSVRKFVFISTDKAACPTSVMGASKRLAEMALIEKFAPWAVFCRFGNVLGSAGSLVEIVEQKLLRKQPITVTDPSMRRYFITAKEAVGLVLTAGLLEESGIAFSLEMGGLVSIMHILAKLCPPNTEFQFGAPGSGEKTDEIILNPGEYFLPTRTGAVKRIWTPNIPNIHERFAIVQHDSRTIVAQAQL